MKLPSMKDIKFPSGAQLQKHVEESKAKFMDGYESGKQTLTESLAASQDKLQEHMESGQETFKRNINNAKATPNSIAISVLSKAFKKDPEYAKSWHAVMAVCMQDEGVDHATSQRAAARIMKAAFEVDVSYK